MEELFRCRKFFIDRLKVLADTYENQCKSIEDFALWNLPNDIAEDWSWENLSYFLDILKENNIISDMMLLRVNTIINNFDNASIDGEFYDPEIWTHNGLKNHPFWDEQRRLAKELLMDIQTN